MRATRMGNTALHLAAAAGRLYTVDLLCRRGIWTEVRNDLRYTPLHSAAASGRPETVKHLVDLGADLGSEVLPEIRSGAQMVALGAKQWAVTAMLRDLYLSMTIHHAVAFGDIPAIEEMIEEDPAMIEATTAGGATPLMVAVVENKPDMVAYLLEKGAKPYSGILSGDRPITVAARRGYTEGHGSAPGPRHRYQRPSQRKPGAHRPARPRAHGRRDTGGGRHRTRRRRQCLGQGWHDAATSGRA